MARKRRPPEEEESKYSWMDTYGDLVTNLLCFFVLLYAFSSIDNGKWSQLVAAFTGEAGTTIVQPFDVDFARGEAIDTVDPMINYDNRTTPDPNATFQPTPDIASPNDAISVGEEFDQLYYNIQVFIEENRLQDNMSVVRTDDMITIRFGEVFLFNSGKAELLSHGYEMLEKIVLLIKDNVTVIRRITIEGHTDNVPISGLYADNWELSTARAVNTLRRVLSYELLDPTMLTAAGCGEYRPVDTNDTEEGRQRNRRVDLVIERIPENRRQSR